MLRSGVTDVSLLKLTFGIGLYLPCLIAWIICLGVLPPKRRLLLLFPIFSMLSLTLAGDAIMTGEHHLLVYLVLPILFLALDEDCHRWPRSLLLVALLVCHTRLYESAMATGSIFCVIFFVRMILSTNTRERLPHAIFFLLSLTSIVIACDAAFFPRDTTNRSSFLSAILYSAGDPTFLISAVFIIPFTIGLMLGEARWLKLGLICFAVLAIVWIVLGQPSPTGLSFATRALTLWYLPLLMVAASLTALLGRQLGPEFRTPLLLFVLAATTLHLGASRHWLSYRKDFKSALDSGSGFVPKEDTPLMDNDQSWGWTSPLMSYLWSEGQVDTIILNASDIGWEPFNPKKEAVLKDYVSLRVPLAP